MSLRLRASRERPFARDHRPPFEQLSVAATRPPETGGIRAARDASQGASTPGQKSEKKPLLWLRIWAPDGRRLRTATVGHSLVARYARVCGIKQVRQKGATRCLVVLGSVCGGSFLFCGGWTDSATCRNARYAWLDRPPPCCPAASHVMSDGPSPGPGGVYAEKAAEHTCSRACPRNPTGSACCPFAIQPSRPPSKGSSSSRDQARIVIGIGIRR